MFPVGLQQFQYLFIQTLDLPLHEVNMLQRLPDQKPVVIVEVMTFDRFFDLGLLHPRPRLGKLRQLRGRKLSLQHTV